jgi:hypothetical protein
MNSLEAVVMPPEHGRCRCALLRVLVPDRSERMTTRNRLDRQCPRE